LSVSLYLTRFLRDRSTFAERLTNERIAMLKKLKSLFVVDDENAKSSDKAPAKGQAKSAPANAPQGQKQQPQIKVDTTPTPKGEGKPDEKFVNRLLQAIEEANLEGFDYLEYKQSLQSIDDMNMDEATMYKSSLAMAKTMGGTPEKLISSAKHYISVLEKEEKKFQNALSNQQQRVVSGRQDTIAKMEASIDSKQKRIEELKAEIIKEKEALEQTKKAAENDASKIHVTKTGFYAAYHIVVDQIKADLQKMQQHF